MHHVIVVGAPLKARSRYANKHIILSSSIFAYGSYDSNNYRILSLVTGRPKVEFTVAM
jgi:hypothetical protein